VVKQLGQRNATRDVRDLAVMHQKHSTRTTSALDYWDQLVTLHYGGRAGICAHFREGTIAETTMAWAGAPFAAPAAATFANSILTVTTAGRAFLFQDMAATNLYDKLASVALVSNTVGDYVGLRLDDGTDDYYLEVVLYCSQATPTQWIVRTRRREAGAVTTQDGDTLPTDPGFVLRMDMYFAGAAWANNWNALPVLHTNMGFAGRMDKPSVLLGGGNLTFVPTRAGVVFVAGAPGETSAVGKVDWFDIGRA
jgi:hypothetical protein